MKRTAIETPCAPPGELLLLSEGLSLGEIALGTPRGSTPSRYRAVVCLSQMPRAAHPMDEHKSESMGFVWKLVRELACGADGARGPAVLFLHHTPRADGSTTRGHGNLTGDGDVIVQLSRDSEAFGVSAGLTQNRNSPSYGLDMAFSIDSENVGTPLRSDGDATSHILPGNLRGQGSKMCAESDVITGVASRRSKDRKIPLNQSLTYFFWRATNDSDDHYVYAVAL